MFERPPPNRSYLKISLIFIIVVFPIVSLAVYTTLDPLEVNSCGYNIHWDNEHHYPVIGIDLNDEYFRIAYLDHNNTGDDYSNWVELATVITDTHGRQSMPTSFDCNKQTTGPGGATRCFMPYPYIETFSVELNHSGAVSAEPLQLMERIALQEHGNMIFSLESEARLVLRRIKAMADKHMGHPITRAIMTVPAHFSDAQRAAIQRAGESACLKFLGISEAPVSASIAYDLNDDDKFKIDERQVLVLDLGSRVADATVMTVDFGVFEIESTAHTKHLGSHWLRDFAAESLVRTWDPQHYTSLITDIGFMRRLANEVDKVMGSLLTKATAEIKVEPNFHATLTRAKLDEIFETPFDAILDLLWEALEKARLKAGDIDNLLLVGGTSGIPGLQQRIEGALGMAAIQKSGVDPVLAVAIGAAKQGDVMAFPWYWTWSCVGFDNNRIAGREIGVETFGGGRVALIHPDNVLPVRSEKDFTKVSDGQNRVKLDIYAKYWNDESPTIIWTLSLKIPSAIGETCTIRVQAELTRNGELVIIARHVESGKSESFIMEWDKSVRFSSSPRAKRMKGGEITVANMLGLPGEQQEL